MVITEIIAAVAIFVFSFWLISANFDVAVSVMIFLSVLLHKEFFSAYRWDLLPIRIFMLAFLVNSVWQLFIWCRKEIKSEGKHLLYLKIKNFISQPFVFLLLLIWIVNGISIIFSENYVESILLYGFFTTIVSMGIVLYTRLKNSPEKVIKLIKTFIFVMFALTIFGFVQLVVYVKTGFIFGSLWNVPDRLPRIGATLWDVNHFGALLASLLPVLGVSILVSKTWKKRLTYALMFIPMTGMLLMTNSRSAWILAFIALLVFVIVQMVRRWGFKAIYGILVAILVAGSVGLWGYSKKDSAFRAHIKDYFHYRIDSFDSHIYLLKGSWQVLEMYPYFGGGYGGFYEQFSKTDIAPTYFGRDPISLTSGLRTPGHSIWGETAAETGWAGIYVFVAFVALVVLTLLYTGIKISDTKKSMILSAMAASIIGWFVAGIFYSYKAEFFWIILFLYLLYAVGIFSKESGAELSFEKVLAYFGNSEKVPYIVLGAIGVVLILFGLGRNHLIPWDEAIYAKIAKNMVNTGDFLTMRWKLSEAWYEKPPLYIWMSALSMLAFGITEFAARFPSAILGIATIIATYHFGRKMFNKTSGFVAALTVAINTSFLYYARASMLDVSTTFFITMALMSYWKTIHNRGKTKYWVLTGVFVGLGALVKNVVGFLPLAVIAFYEIYLLATRQARFAWKKYLVLAGVTLAVFLPWHIYMYLKFGQEFINEYVVYHIIERGFNAIEDKGKPFGWYFIVLKVSMRIWFIALLAAFPFTVYRAAIKMDKNQMFLLLSSFVIFLFFSFSKSKLVWYIMPIYPLLGLQVGRFMERFLNFVMEKIPQLDRPVFKTWAIYSLTIFALLYLFLVRGLVYVTDSTGAQAELLKLKEEEFGTDDIVYIDKVQLPVIMFYLDGPYQTVEYSGLEAKLLEHDYTDKIIYITKEGRQERIEGAVPDVVLVENIEDHVLGYLESDFNRDKDRLETIERVLERELGKSDTNFDLINNLLLEKAEILSRLEAYQISRVAQ